MIKVMVQFRINIFIMVGIACLAENWYMSGYNSGAYFWNPEVDKIQFLLLVTHNPFSSATGSKTISRRDIGFCSTLEGSSQERFFLGWSLPKFNCRKLPTSNGMKWSHWRRGFLCKNCYHLLISDHIEKSLPICEYDKSATGRNICCMEHYMCSVNLCQIRFNLRSIRVYGLDIRFEVRVTVWQCHMSITIVADNLGGHCSQWLSCCIVESKSSTCLTTTK